VLDTVRELEIRPEIQSIAFSTEIPLVQGRDKRRFFQIEGQIPADSNNRHEALKNAVSANFHEVLNIPLLKGRYFNDSDDKNNPQVTLINQSFVNKYFAGEDPIDQRISQDGGESWFTVRGVVGDIREVGINIEPTPTFYVPWVASWQYDLQLLVKTKAPFASTVNLVTDIIHKVNVQQAIASAEAYDFIKDESIASSKLVGLLVSLFAILAFLITLSGVMGVVAYNVSQRRKEIGIRIALGANPNRIRGLFALQGLSLCGIGIAVGAFVMVFISPVLGDVLFETDPLNFPLYLLTAFMIALVAAVAMLLPIRQATSVEPNDALREQ